MKRDHFLSEAVSNPDNDPASSGHPSAPVATAQQQVRWTPEGLNVFISTGVSSDSSASIYAAGDFKILDQSLNGAGEGGGAALLLRTLLQVFLQNEDGGENAESVDLRQISFQNTSGTGPVKTHIVWVVPTRWTDRRDLIWWFLMKVRHGLRSQATLLNVRFGDFDLLQSEHYADQTEFDVARSSLLERLSVRAPAEIPALDAMVADAVQAVRSRFHRRALRETAIEITGLPPVVIGGEICAAPQPNSELRRRQVLGTVDAFDQKSRKFNIMTLAESGKLIKGEFFLASDLVGPDGKVDVCKIFSFQLDDKYTDNKLVATYLRVAEPATLEQITEHQGELFTRDSDEPLPKAA